MPTRPLPTSDRKAWIDIAKALGIWLVVWAHLPQGNLAVKAFFYTFHMPLFFFLSGYLLKPQSLWLTLQLGVRRLLLPYLLYALLAWACWLALAVWKQPALLQSDSLVPGYVLKPLLGVVYAVGDYTDSSLMINMPVWFLVGLYVMAAIFALLLSTLSPLRALLACLCLATLPYALAQQGTDLLWSIDSALMALPFYALGHYLAGVSKSPQARALAGRIGQGPGRAVWLCGALLAGAVTAAIAAHNGRVDINLLQYGASPFWFYAGGVSGIAMVLLLAVGLSALLRGDWLLTLSRGTIVILGLHSIVLGGLLSAMRLLGLERGTLQDGAAALLLVLAFVPVIHWVERRAPVLMGR
ncbi:acyltransferase family protein [Ideonella sp.]|jgi:acyltransferase|uniref:acyltransferase family protein n=1 Tax=Ideonella sp. TaxID=1929293 RepID=UPI0037BF3650